MHCAQMQLAGIKINGRLDYYIREDQTTCRLNFHISYSFIDSDCSLQLCICRPRSKVYQDDMHSFFGKYCASMCKDKFNSYM